MTSARNADVSKKFWSPWELFLCFYKLHMLLSISAKFRASMMLLWEIKLNWNWPHFPILTTSARNADVSKKFWSPWELFLRFYKLHMLLSISAKFHVSTMLLWEIKLNWNLRHFPILTTSARNADVSKKFPPPMSKYEVKIPRWE